MKKIFLSSLLIISFSVYALYKKSVTASDLNPIVVNESPVSALPTSSKSSQLPTTSQNVLATPAPTDTPQLTFGFRDGSYTGSVSDAFYGYIQVKAVISNGKLTDVIFLRFPNDHDRSIFINQQAMPYLKSEAITAQSAHVNIVSGATDSSQAFIQSLSSALELAKS